MKAQAFQVAAPDRYELTHHGEVAAAKEPIMARPYRRLAHPDRETPLVTVEPEQQHGDAQLGCAGSPGHDGEPGNPRPGGRGSRAERKTLQQAQARLLELG